MTEVKKASQIGVKHEYTDLEVDEISVVDFPANEHEFAVIKCIKNNKECEMSDKNETEVVSVEVEKSDEEVDVMGQIAAQVESIEKSISDLTPEVVVSPPEVKVVNKIEVEKSEETPASIFAAALKASGATDDQIKKASEKYSKVCACGNVKKSIEPQPQTTEEEVGKEVDFLGELVSGLTKAKSITPGRLESIKAAQEILSKMIAEIEGVPHAKSPKTKAPSNASFGNSGIKELTVTKALAKIVGTIDVLNEKIMKIEKTRQPSSTLVDDQPETVKKSDDLWGSVLG